MRNIIIIVSVLVLSIADVFCQDFTMDDCIRIAIENNIDIQRALLNHESARITMDEAKSSRLPTLDLNFNVGQNYGRSIDPFTNDYVNQQLTFSNTRLNSNLLLYNGMRVKYEIERSQNGLAAADLERKELEDNLALAVTRAYLEVLNIKAILELSKKRLESTTQSMEQIQRTFDAGTGDPSAFYDFKGQLAADQLRIVDAENLLKSTRMVLFQLLNIPYDEGIRFENFNESLADSDYEVDEIFSDANTKFAAFEAREQRIQESRLAIKAQKAALMPSVFLFAGLNSNYSSAARRLTILEEVVQETGNFVEFQQQQIPVLERTNNTTVSNISYGNQIVENISPNFGIAVSYPIWNQNLQRNNIQRSEVELNISQLERKRLDLEFRQAIETAILNYNNAKDRLELLQAQVEAFEKSFQINQVKLDNGVSNQLEFIVSYNNLETAKLTLSNAMFELLLQQQIIEFYKS